MELRIPEEGKAVYVGEDEILLAYYGSEIELRFKTEPPHGDLSVRDNFPFDVFHQPGTPFRKGIFNPTIACRFSDVCHKAS